MKDSFDGLAKKVTTLLATATLGISVSQASAQERITPYETTTSSTVSQRFHEPETFTRGQSPLIAVAGNGVLGGIAGCLGHEKNGESCWEGFREGFGASAIAATGRWVAGKESPLAGKFMSDLGTSLMISSVEGDDWGDDYVMNLGPFHIHAHSDNDFKIESDLLMEKLYGIHLHQMRGGDIDWGESLKSLSIVMKGGDLNHGKSYFGIPGVNESDGVLELEDDNRVLRLTPKMIESHERLHGLQYDFSASYGRLFRQYLPDGVNELVDDLDGVSLDSFIGYSLLYSPQHMLPHGYRMQEQDAFSFSH